MNFLNSVEISGKLPVLRHVLEFSKGNFPNTQKSEIPPPHDQPSPRSQTATTLCTPSPSYCNYGEDTLSTKLSAEIFMRLCHPSLADILCYFLNKSVMCNGGKNSSSRPNINLRLKRQAITWNMENKALRRPSSRKPLLTSNLTNTKFHIS